MVKLNMDHVAILVEDLDKAVEDWKKILKVLDPEGSKEIVKLEGDKDRDDPEEAEEMDWVTFVSENCTIQLVEPKTPGGYLDKLLEKRGEGVHHICFTSNKIEDTFGELKKEEIPLAGGLRGSPEHPIKFGFISPEISHGVLIEVAQRYKVDEGEWKPDREQRIT